MRKAEKKKPILCFSIGILLIAGILDLKYKGLFYGVLPEGIQSRIDEIF